ncbi:MAG: alpha/beta hydrolase [Deinococcus sp.]|nr:alpha/beta hydrolase [Deinococcus sp.]
MREEIEVVDLGEIELYTEDTGPLDAPALVVLHGGPGGSCYAIREGIGDELQDYRTIYFDQRGGGRSGELPAEPRLFTIDALVEDLEALRLHFDISSWTLLGHGFGAMPALEYARKFAENVRDVVLINPWTNFPLLAEKLYRASLRLRGMPEDLKETSLRLSEAPSDPLDALREAFSQLEPKAVFDSLIFPTAHGRLEFEWLEEGEGILGADTPGRMLVQNGLWQFDYTPYLADLALPVSVLLGEADGTCFPEAQDVANITGGGLEIVYGAGHYPWIDQPEATSQALAALLGPGAED